MKLFCISALRWFWQRSKLFGEHRVNFWSGVVLIAWAKILFWTSASLDDNINYKITIEIFDEAHLEFMAFAIGTLQIIAVLIDKRWLRNIACGLAAWFCFTLAYSIAIGPILVPGIAFQFGWGCINVHSMLSSIKRHKCKITKGDAEC